jgi:hypothetical protein
MNPRLGSNRHPAASGVVFGRLARVLLANMLDHRAIASLKARSRDGVWINGQIIGDHPAAYGGFVW